MSKILLFVVLLIGAIILGLSTLLFLFNSIPQSTTPPAVLDYKNITYVVEKQPVTLVNGYSEIPSATGEVKIVTKYFGNEATGELNGDGVQDVTFLLTQEMGGTGMFYYLAVALKTDTGYQATSTIFLGDRITPQPNQIGAGGITVNYVDRKPSDAMSTAPSVGVSRYFNVKNNVLVEQMDAGTFAIPATFVINQKVKFGDGLIVSLKEINDSRCKQGSVCAWAGELAPLFSIIGGDVGNSAQEVRLGSVATKKITKNGYAFELKDVTQTIATIFIVKDVDIINK